MSSLPRRIWDRVKNAWRAFWIKWKNFFENNEKAFTVPLQIFSTIVLGCAGLYISYLGGKTSQREEEAHEVQMEAIRDNAEPAFTIKSRHIDGKFEDDGYSYTKKIYTIMNKGGKISGAYLSDVRKSMIIEIYGGGLPLEYKFKLDVGDLFEKSEGLMSLYDEDEKEFIFYERETSRIDELESNLRSKIENMLTNKQKATINIYWENTVCVEYINYKNKELIQYYQFIPGDALITYPKDDSERLGSTNIKNNIDYVAKKASSKIEEFMNSGKIQNPISYDEDYNAEGEREQALMDAEHYLNTYPSSRKMLLDVLENNWDYYHEDAVYAVDNCGADWNMQATKRAKQYLSFGPISYEQLIDALEEDEKFTRKQAVYGASNCEADWNEQAKWKAEQYKNLSTSYSREEIIEKLEFEDKFTREQADYGASAAGY